MKPLDPYTFGDSPAAVNLASMLTNENDQRLASKVARKINHYCTLISQTDHIDPAYRGAFLRLIAVSFRQSKAVNDCPKLIQSHTMNVITGFYRDALRKCNRQQAEKKADQQRTAAKAKTNISL